MSHGADLAGVDAAGLAFDSLLTLPEFAGLVRRDDRFIAVLMRPAESPLALLLPREWMANPDTGRAMGSLVYVALTTPEWLPAPASFSQLFQHPLLMRCTAAILDVEPLNEP